MQSKRKFLAAIGTVLCLPGIAPAQNDNNKALREREIDLKGKNPLSLKEYYLELIEKDEVIKRQFAQLEDAIIGEARVHYHGRSQPTVHAWFPSEVEWGHAKNEDYEVFLVFHPVSLARSHHEWTEGMIISEFECTTKHLEDAKGEETSSKAVYSFLGFKKMNLEPIKL